MLICKTKKVTRKLTLRKLHMLPLPEKVTFFNLKKVTYDAQESFRKRKINFPFS